MNEQKRLNISNNVFNTESIIYMLNDDLLLKEIISTDPSLIENKIITIDTLNNMKEILPNNFIIPNNTYISNNKLYIIMDYFKSITLMDYLINSHIEVKDKLNVLKKVGQLLDNIINNKINFNINDLYEGNILINPTTKEIKISDLDSSRIGNYAFSSKYLNKKNPFILKNSKYSLNQNNNGLAHILANNNSDLLCYTIILLNFLYKGNILNMDIKSFYDYLNYLESIGINKDLINIFDNLLTPNDNINPFYLIDSITETQTYRTRKLVFDVNNKRKYT